MRELERNTSTDTPSCSPPVAAGERARIAVVGRGRLGGVIAPALRAAGYEVLGPLGRGADAAGAQVALLCVPDGQIGAAAAAIAGGPIVGHCSGASGLDGLASHARSFSLHPLMTVTGASPTVLAGAGAAIAGSDAVALSTARTLALALGMRPVEVAAEDRVAYHAAASIASNFLVALEAAAERLAETAGVGRELLVPLVRQTVESWSELGPERALTGPVARGDELTVARQRAAVAARTPELVGLFDALTTATRALAGAPATEQVGA